MRNIFKSMNLDHSIMKSRYPMFIIGYVLGALLSVISKTPIYGALVVMIISAPLTGQYFSIYEKNNLEKLYGILPLRKAEVVVGRYLYAMCIVVINGAIAAMLAYIISTLTNKPMNLSEFLTYLSVGFLYVCLMLAVIFPLYFKFSFSKIYTFSNLPFYLIFIITFAFTRKTNVLERTGLTSQYFASHVGMIAAVGLGLGLILLALSCLLSCALIEGNRAACLPAENPGKRIYFADNLRTWMVILVMLQHLAEIFSLYLFLMLNQAYFMGLLFLLSGYFTPGSFERRKPGTFLKDRLLRLGVPTLLYVFILSPVARIGAHGLAGNTTANLFALGPMWFAVMLLVFDLGYLAWRMVVKNRPERPVPEKRMTLTFPKAALFTLALAAAGYLLRIGIPYGIPVLGFPSLGYLPQYLSFFLIGMLAYKRDWLRTVSGSLGKIGFVLAVFATVVLLPVALFIGSGSVFIGYGSWQSAVFALWDSIFAVGMSVALITFFRRYVSGGKKFGQFLSHHSFTVYVIHAPILVFLALALRSLQIQPLLKFCLAAVVYLPLSFGIAWLVRKIPYLKKVL